MNERRREIDLPWYWQLVHFLLAFLVDGWHGLSLSRLVACFCCLAVGNDTFVRDHPLDWVDFCILALAVATSFGKMTYTAFLQRLTIGVNTSSSSSRTVTTDTTSNSEGDRG